MDLMDILLSQKLNSGGGSGGGGGVSVQSDWNENNPQSKAYIQNKPFYEEFGEKELVYGPTSIDKAGTQVPDAAEGIYYIQFQITLSGDITFNENDHLVLTLDDTEFEFALEGSSNLYRNFNTEFDAISLLSSGSCVYMLGMNEGSWTFVAMIPVTSSDQKTYIVNVYKIESNTHKLPARFVDLKVPQSIMDGSEIASVRCAMAAEEIGLGAFAEGVVTTASGRASHAEGSATVASGPGSHAEGDGAIASGSQSHAEGYRTTASGTLSHAEGNGTTASGLTSHAEGLYTIANHASQHVFGEYNVADPSTANASSRGTYVEIVGNGTKNGKTESRSNARTLDWDGNEVLAGKLTVGAAPTADMDVATKKYVDDNVGGGMNIVNLSGTQITQVGADNTFYVCGELSELTFTAPAVGITMIRFTSGTTPTVLTVNGVTSWMFDNDPTAASLEANKTYDINVLNGVGVVGWA